jgi:DNA-binding NarL/FixJ family response regulator
VTASPTCLVADDHPALVVAVCDYLEASGYAIVGPARDGAAAIDLAEAERPQLALVDYRMPRSSGAELLRRLAVASPATLVAVYTADGDARLAREALGAGARAVLLKEAPLADLERALGALLDGGSYVDSALAGAELRAGGPCTELTTRELQVLGLLAEGLSHEQIGRRLEIGSETVRTHARKAADRLGARTRTQAVAEAIRAGLLA